MRRAVIGAAMLLALGAVTGCEGEGPAEEAGEAIDNTADDAGDAMEDLGDKAQDATE